jgi:hypothetical protein
MKKSETTLTIAMIRNIEPPLESSQGAQARRRAQGRRNINNALYQKRLPFWEKGWHRRLKRIRPK